MRIKNDITDYKNFWLIWLNSASTKDGVSLFKIQTDWNIKTNYLYHNEVGLETPLFRSMIRQSYITKEGKRLKPLFEWIPEYIKSKHRPSEKEDTWSNSEILNEKWPKIQQFIEKYHSVLFSPKNLKLLYRNEKDIIGSSGHLIFTDIFAYVLFSNLRTFCRKYEADIVLRMMATLVSLSTDRDLLNYMHELDSELKSVQDFPLIIGDEKELSSVLCTLKW